MPKAIDLTGQRFGKLVAKKYMFSDRHGRYWLCECDCGKEKIANTCELRRGDVVSCGCKRHESIKKAQAACVSHGLSGTRLYGCYHAMLKRCKYEPNWVNKGITVCKEWEDSPQAFFDWALSNGYRDDLTLDRINVYGNYEPSNCRWLSKKDQQCNKTTNHFVTINGVTKTISQWSELSGVSSPTILKRIEHGFSDADLIVPTGTIYRGQSKKRTSYKHLVTINGETKSITEWHKCTGLSMAMIQQRINRGFKNEEIIAPKYSIYRSKGEC